MAKAKLDKLYYNIRDDLRRLPTDCQFLVVYGGRATGKTYSGLRTVYEDKIKFLFLKREVEDVKNLCGGRTIRTAAQAQANKVKRLSFKMMDTSPFAPLNRDFGWNVKPFLIQEGLGAFYDCDDNDNPVGEPVGYLMALANAAKFKGFNMDDVDVIIFDEFCPIAGMRKNKAEGTMILDLIPTISRDRHLRGRKPLQVWCFANADNIACPLTETLEIIDDLSDMTARKEEFRYCKKRRVYLHLLHTSEERLEYERQVPIYQAMAGTKWLRKSLENDFAYNDFSNVKDASIKGFQPEARVFYQDKWHYVYVNINTGYRRITYIPVNIPVPLVFNLDTDNGIQAFRDYAYKVVLHYEGTTLYATFESYALYNLYINARHL